MSIKRFLGLDSCPLTEDEIIKALEDAVRKHLDEIEFSFNGQKIKMHVVNSVEPKGIFDDDFSYYTET